VKGIEHAVVLQKVLGRQAGCGKILIQPLDLIGTKQSERHLRVVHRGLDGKGINIRIRARTLDFASYCDSVIWSVN
jgi:hypothetical protein